MSDLDLSKLKRKEPAAFVRFTESEFLTLTKDAIASGRNIQRLLKESYFGKGPNKILFHREDAQNFLRELHRIGVNVNQIAKALNSGFREGWYDAFGKIADDMNSLKKAILTDGIR